MKCARRRIKEMRKNKHALAFLFSILFECGIQRAVRNYEAYMTIQEKL